MIVHILNLLDFARAEEWRGQYIDIALGKNKYPETLKEGLTQYKNGLWARR